MTDTQILSTLADMLAERVAAVVEQRLRQSAKPAPPAEYDPTRRLSRREAARHLGISVRTLDSRVKDGKIWKYTPDGQAPYFLLGELDGNLAPGSARKSATGVRRRG